MADSKAHKLGQMIGEFIEKQFEKELCDICSDRGLFLDVVGKNRPARGGKKVKWMDVFGSFHDLDFVIERNGTATSMGTPAALIECAWRRYTKHSKNKAQEIQGAVLPIAEKYKFHKPFLGAILAGQFTGPSLEQLKGCGFEVLYFDYEHIVHSFQAIGVDVSFEENTSDHEAGEKVKILENLTESDFSNVFSEMIRLNASKVELFKESLIECLDRQIAKIIITPLYGKNFVFDTVDDAYNYLSGFRVGAIPEDIVFDKHFIMVEYSNGDKITGEFSNCNRAIDFVKGLTG